MGAADWHDGRQGQDGGGSDDQRKGCRYPSACVLAAVVGDGGHLHFPGETLSQAPHPWSPAVSVTPAHHTSHKPFSHMWTCLWARPGIMITASVKLLPMANYTALCTA